LPIHSSSPLPAYIYRLFYTVLSKNHLNTYSICLAITSNTLTRRGRQKGSTPLGNGSTGSVATNPLGRWNLFDAAIKCVHPAIEVGRGPTSLCLDLVIFTYQLHSY
jgi:hypothetical protein